MAENFTTLKVFNAILLKGLENKKHVTQGQSAQIVFCPQIGKLYWCITWGKYVNIPAHCRNAQWGGNGSSGSSLFFVIIIGEIQVVETPLRFFVVDSVICLVITPGIRHSFLYIPLLTPGTS